MKLVPCRWSRTGWKYVEADPNEHKFFGNPNRANCHGYQSPRGRQMDRTKKIMDDTFMTTSMKFFSQDRQPNINPWDQMNKTGAPVKNSGGAGGVQWAGEFHPNRGHFKRSKDHITEWTKVCFRP